MNTNQSIKQPDQNRNPIFLIVSILIIVTIGLYLAVRKNSNNTPETTDTMKNMEQKINEPSANPTAGVNDNGTVKSFTVTGDNFSFSLNEIRVKKGDTVKINFKNNEGFHDWVLDEFNIRTAKLAVGKNEEIKFIADKTGIFEYYCSVGNHRQQGMKGKLIVE